MSHIGPVRGIGFFVALARMPTFNLAHWVLNILVFTLMYTVMSSAWNLVGGFAGYPSLGHAAFFGIGAYSMNLWFENRALSSGYEPFLFLPVIGVFAALIGLGVAAIAMRARADVFAIVTITLLFVAQTLAFNLRGLTHGAQGIAMAVPPFPAATFAFDPKGGIHSDQSGVFSTDAAPVLHGAGVTSPAWPFTTWLSTAGCRPVHHSPLPKALVTPTPPGTR